NGTLDQATPLAWARNVASQLPESALLAVNGAETHASYLRGNECVREIAHRYLLDGELPGPGTECDQE
ncbi:MAG: alpha/beta hydrolase, partial [Stackebrandtia sp.]